MKGSTPIHKATNSLLIELFYKAQETYFRFLSEQTPDNWKLFWKYLRCFYDVLESDYRDIHFIFYRDIQWSKYWSKKNTVHRMLTELLGLLYEFITPIVIVSVICTLSYFFGVLLHIPGYNRIMLSQLMIFPFVSIIIWAITMILAPMYLVYKKP